METIDRGDDSVINLFDHYNQVSWDLHFSLIKAGYHHPTISLQDDGFLPEDVTSPYQFYTGFDARDSRPLYYNQAPIPDYWEIVGTNTDASIYDLGKKRGHIHYASPSHKRLIKEIDWYDDKGKVQLKEHYNKQGYHFATTIYNADSQAVQMTYLNDKGMEVLSENLITGDIILNDDHQFLVFKSKVDFIHHYLKDAGFQLDRIFYNSLATPFLTSFYLKEAGEDILFWHEPIGDSLPGNMQTLLQGTARPTKIIFQNAAAYQKAQTLLTDEQKQNVDFLGFMYLFGRENKAQPQALILTNSDQIQDLEVIVNALPNLQVHVGAITEMSPKLQALGKYANVTLYPNISTQQVNALYQQCDIYLDINHYNEILSAVRTAFEHNLVIFAYEETAHNRQFVAPDHIFQQDQTQDVISQLNQALASPDNILAQLDKQRAAAHIATVADYQALIG